MLVATRAYKIPNMQFVGHQFAGVRALKSGVLPSVGRSTGLHNRDHARCPRWIGQQIGIRHRGNETIVGRIQNFESKGIRNTLVPVHQVLIGNLLTRSQALQTQPIPRRIGGAVHAIGAIGRPIVEGPQNKGVLLERGIQSQNHGAVVDIIHPFHRSGR